MYNKFDYEEKKRTVKRQRRALVVLASALMLTLFVAAGRDRQLNEAERYSRRMTDNYEQVIDSLKQIANQYETCYE